MSHPRRFFYVELLLSESRLVQFATIVEKLIQQIELLNERNAESFNKSYLINLETKISTAVLPVKEKLIARLHEANFHDRSVVQPSSKTSVSLPDRASQPSMEGLSTCINAVNATEVYYNGQVSAQSVINNNNNNTGSSAYDCSVSELTKKLRGSKAGFQMNPADESMVAPMSLATAPAMTPFFPSFAANLMLSKTTPAPTPSAVSLAEPMLKPAKKERKAPKEKTTAKPPSNRSKSSSQQSLPNSAVCSPSMTQRLSGQLTFDLMSEGYTTSSSVTTRGKDNVSESEGSTDMDLMDDSTAQAGLVHSASVESFHLGFAQSTVDSPVGAHTHSHTAAAADTKDGLLSQPFMVEIAHDDDFLFGGEYSGPPDFQADQINFDEYCYPAVTTGDKVVNPVAKSTGSRQGLVKAEKRKSTEKECAAPQASTMLIEPMVGYPEDCEFRMSSKRRRRLSQIVPNPRKPRTADYSCSVCSEPYQRVAEENPWWAVYLHECPKCASVQVPRLDISLASNAIELDPNVVALYGEGIDDGDVEGFEGYALYEEDEDSCDDDEEEVDEFMDEEEIKRDAFPFDGEGYLTRDQASQLLVLMSHARTCSGEHKSEELGEVCRSTKFLMLHVRDCPGVDANGNQCRYSWCAPTKKMLRHLTRCFEPTTCGICCANSVKPSYAQLCKINNTRASAVPVINEKLTYASRLESRDELAIKMEAKRRQEALALMGSESSQPGSALSLAS